MILPPPHPFAQQTCSHPPVQDTHTTPDARIASLKGIFPDFDDAVILGVLESTGNDHDRALDVLLGMSDPSFVPPTSTRPQSQPPRPNQFQSDPSLDAQHLSQEALDEQFAKRLALEEQEQAVARAQALQDVPSYSMYQPYQTRRGGRNGTHQPQTQGQGGKDTMTEFHEGFNRIAETGKKTFSSIVNKVRAKMHEFEQGQGWSGSQNPPRDQVPPQTTPAWSQQDSGHGAYTPPYAGPKRQPSQPGYPSSPPRSGVVRPPQTEPAQPSYYDPNARGYDLYGDDEIQITDNTNTTPMPPAVAPPAVTTPKPSAAAPSIATQNSMTMQNPTTSLGTDNPSSPSTASPPPSYASPVLSSSTSNPILSSTTPPARSLSPTITGKGAPGPGGVDFSKLGLLPKRPISLVRPQSPADPGVNPARLSVADSESTLASPTTGRNEPEFVQNPFEDPK